MIVYSHKVFDAGRSSDILDRAGIGGWLGGHFGFCPGKCAKKSRKIAH